MCAPLRKLIFLSSGAICELSTKTALTYLGAHGRLASLLDISTASLVHCPRHRDLQPWKLGQGQQHCEAIPAAVPATPFQGTKRDAGLLAISCRLNNGDLWRLNCF